MPGPGSLLTNGSRFRLLLHDEDFPLYFDYDASAADVVCDPACAGWSPLAEPDVLLQKLFLLGSEHRFASFFANLVRACDAFNVDRPLSHVVYLELNDCRADANALLRTFVIDPFLSQVVLVGHLQWAWHYQIKGHLPVALEHLDAAEHVTANLRPSPYLLSAGRISELKDDVWTLRARLRAREHRRRSGTVDGLQTALADLGRVTEARKRSFAYLLSVYECANAVEQAARRFMSPAPESSGPDDLSTAEALFSDCVAHLSDGTRTDAHTLLLAAARLGLARVANFRAGSQLGSHRRRAVPAAVGHADAARQIIESSCASVGPTITGLMRAASLAEARRWEEAADEWRRIGSDPPQGTGEQGLAALNLCLLHLVRDEPEQAVLAAILYTPVASFHKLAFCHLVLRLGRSCPSAPALATALETRMREGLDRPVGGDDEVATIRRLAGSSDSSDIHLVLRGADVVRYRRFEKANLDLLLVRLALQWYEACVLKSPQSPFYVASSHLPRIIWDRLCSSTRWMMFELFGEGCLRRDVLERTHRVLCDTLTAEYDRHIVTPLRLAYRALGNSTWKYVPSPNAPTEVLDPTAAVDFTGPSKKTRINGSIEAYIEHDLYRGEMELSLLEALLRKNKGFGFEKPVVDALKALRATNTDSVGVLLGPVAETTGMWIGQSNQQERERDRLHRAVKILKTARDYHAHRSQRAQLPNTDALLMSWRYLTTTAIIGSGTVRLGDFGARTVWDRPAGDPRDLWSMQKA